MLGRNMTDLFIFHNSMQVCSNQFTYQLFQPTDIVVVLLNESDYLRIIENKNMLKLN